MKVIAEDSFKDGELEGTPDSADGGCAPAATALHGQYTLTYFHYEPQKAADLG